MFPKVAVIVQSFPPGVLEKSREWYKPLCNWGEGTLSACLFKEGRFPVRYWLIFFFWRMPKKFGYNLDQENEGPMIALSIKKRAKVLIVFLHFICKAPFGENVCQSVDYSLVMAQPFIPKTPSPRRSWFPCEQSLSTRPRAVHSSVHSLVKMNFKKHDARKGLVPGFNTYMPTEKNNRNIS